MLVDKYGVLTEKGWEEVEKLFCYEKFKEFMHALDPTTRILILAAICSTMDTMVVGMNSYDFIEASIKEQKNVPL